MLKYITLLFSLVMISCSSSTEQPSNKLSKGEMAEIIADLAIYHQGQQLNTKVNWEEINRFVFKKHNITAKDFKDNYQYYIYTPSSLDNIHSKAKKIILEKDPNLKDSIINNSSEQPKMKETK